MSVCGNCRHRNTRCRDNGDSVSNCLDWECDPDQDSAVKEDPFYQVQEGSPAKAEVRFPPFTARLSKEDLVLSRDTKPDRLYLDALPSLYMVSLVNSELAKLRAEILSLQAEVLEATKDRETLLSRLAYTERRLEEALGGSDG